MKKIIIILLALISLNTYATQKQLTWEEIRARSPHTKWELVGFNYMLGTERTDRLNVPNGWIIRLIRLSSNINEQNVFQYFFVPDPTHAWTVDVMSPELEQQIDARNKEFMKFQEKRNARAMDALKKFKN